MLKSIKLTRFGTIPSALWEPSGHWIALTGETGTGKTLLVEALQCITGARFRPRWLPTEGSWAEVEAVFSVPPHPEVHRYLQGAGIEPDNGEIIVQRRLSREGNSKIWTQNRRITLNRLRQIMGLIVDICDQWGITRLLSPSSQKQWLDSFASLTEVLLDLRSIAVQLNRIARRWRNSHDADWLRQRIEILRHEWKELDAAHLDPNEFDELDRAFRIQGKITQYREVLESLIRIFSEGEDSLSDLLAQGSRNLRYLSDLNPDFSVHSQNMEEWGVYLEGILYDLLQARNRLAWDEEDWARIEQRMALIQSFLRKYRTDIHGLIMYRDNLLRDIQKLEEELDERLHGHTKAGELFGQYLEIALAVSKRRREAAHPLEIRVTDYLRRLGMPAAQFRIEVNSSLLPDTWSPDLKINESGVDQVEFRFAADEHRPLLPLSEVASGGELARLTLALKAATRGSEWPRTLVFDEIDIGVGGETLETVGDLLQEIAEFDQVLMVTHWPQLAARAGEHWNITRTPKDSVILNKIMGEDRINELARMFGGQEEHAAREHAKALIKSSAS